MYLTSIYSNNQSLVLLFRLNFWVYLRMLCPVVIAMLCTYVTIHSYVKAPRRPILELYSAIHYEQTVFLQINCFVWGGLSVLLIVVVMDLK